MRGIFVFLLLSINLCFAQQIEVVAKNTNGQSLSNINVQLQKNEKTLAFQKTNAKGMCFFTPKTSGDYTLKFTSMRYKTKFLEINTTQKTSFRVSLQSEIKEIQEVTIKARPKISKAKGDTISYNIKAIKDGTERTAEDLIKKIPGLDITDNGKVTHNGNMIEQVLVEGNEFFGKNHKMSTQNITADMLDGVDLWKNYTTVNGNSSTALNLKLKDKYKGKITGTLEGNYGTRNSYLVHSNLFKFNKIGNLALITDFNNSAQSPISFMDFHEMNKQEDIDNVNGVTHIETPSFLENDNKIEAKNNQFGALQYSKSWKKNSISAFSILNFSQLKKEAQSNRKVFAGQNTALDFQETKRENNKGFFGTTQIKFRKNFKDNSFIYYNFGYNPIQDDFNRITDRIAEDPAYFNINNKVRSNTLSHFLSWNKIWEKSKMVWAFSHIKKDFNENLNIGASQEVFDTNSTELLQNYKGKNHQYLFDFYFNNSNDWVSINLHSGYKKNDIHSELNEIATQSTAQQNLNYHHFLNSIKLTKYIGNFNLSASLSSNYLDVNQRQKHYFENYFKIKYRYSENVNSNYSLDYRTSYKLPEHHLLFQKQFYTKELITHKNQDLNPISLSKNKSISFKWNRFNQYKGNLTFLILRYTETEPQFTTNTSNYGILSEVGHLATGKQKSWFLLLSNHVNLGEYWTLKTKLIGQNNRSRNLISNQKNTLNFKNIQLSQKLSSSFKEFPVQLDLGYQISENSFAQTLFDRKSKTQNFNFNLGLRTLIGKEWKMNLLGEYLIQKTPNNRLNNFLIGGHLSYQKEKSTLEYHLKFNNILNLNSFQYINNQLSSFGFLESSVTAFHGYIMGGLKLHF